MSSSGAETLVGCEAGTGGSTKKKDSLGFTSSPAHLIIKDLGEIHSRLLDHRPVIQGETHYFVKEFEEKRGLQEILQAATDSINKDFLIASEKQHIMQWEDFMKEQHSKQAEVDEEHRKSMEKLRKQYAEIEKDLARFSTF
ncbi:hypothetical protein FD755_016168 [Muntiacus reevesi]|uniref:Biogenesis of lysosome-related organelles complex 1 subunit 5 n=1 Tax=Muntiacus reevesi TaxID=9886 RepID=A0A5N3XGK7_MUNRE|nr:hypothetical protein FD755_016168 [Muntiacus reevesi]